MNHSFSLFSILGPILFIVLAAAAIFIIISIVKKLFRIAVIAAIIGLILTVGLGYSPAEILNKGKQMSSSYFQNNIKPVIDQEFKNAHVVKGPNGTIEFAGDQFDIGETPEGKFVFNIKPLNISIPPQTLAKYLNSTEMQKLLYNFQSLTQSSPTKN